MSEAPASTLMTWAESTPGNRIPQTHSSQATTVKNADDLTWGDMANTQICKTPSGDLSTKLANYLMDYYFRPRAPGENARGATPVWRVCPPPPRESRFRVRGEEKPGNHWMLPCL